MTSSYPVKPKGCFQMGNKMAKNSDASENYWCTFCMIANGKDKEADVLKKDHELVCFRDIWPAAPHHYLVVPVEHIVNCASLHTGHVGLAIPVAVEKMAEMGRAVLREQGFAHMEDIRMGFHHPAYTSVDHLHLHVLAPASMIKEVLMFKFRPGSLAFIEDEELLCFRDVKPGAGHHYLVITRRHICNCKALRAQHIPTVERMAEMGKCALEKNKVRDLKDIRLGFHVPPFSSVPHLHLHALAPASKMNESSQRRYGPQSHWFISRLAGRGNAVAAQDTRPNQMKSSVE
ncbi:uncharacterized protein ACBT44_000374 isoform 4-T4 [Syngnathus typhle]